MAFFGINFHNIGRAIRGSSASSKSGDSRQGQLRHTLAATLLVAFVALAFSNPIALFASRTFFTKPEVVIARSQWKVSLEDKLDCTGGSSHCAPRDFLKRFDWKSTLSLDDPDLFQTLRSLEGKKFWIGMELGPPMLSAAKQGDARSLLVGVFNAGYRVFVNEDLRAVGDGKDFLPPIIELSESEIASKSVRILIEVNHSLGSAFPIAMVPREDSGLMSFRVARDLRDKNIMYMSVMPLVRSTLAMTVAIAFWTIWFLARGNQETLIFGLFIFCYAASQFLGWGHIKFSFHRSFSYELGFVLRVFQGCFACLIGLAYARLRRAYFDLVITTGAVILVYGFMQFASPSDYFFGGARLAEIYVPLCFLFGALACLSQWMIGSRDGFSGMTKQDARIRTKRLGTFGLIFFVASIVFHFDSKNIPVLDSSTMSSVYFQFLVVGILAFYLIRDFIASVRESFEIRIKFRISEALMLRSQQVAHDFQSPLAALEIFLDDCLELSGEQQERVVGAVRRIREISEDLLSGTQQNAETSLEGRRRTTVLQTAIENILHEKRIVYRSKKKIDLQCNEPSEAAKFHLDVPSTVLERLLSNLIENSIESMTAGCVRVTTQRESGGVIILIEDNGKGMPSEVLSQLGSKRISFGKIGRESRAGLGVFHAFQAVNRCGGKIKFDSKEGVGTTVRIYFPREKIIEMNRDAILLDNDEEIHRLWMISARKAGIKIRCFRSTKAFLREVETIPFGVSVYIDSNLGDGEPRGEDFARLLFERGYKTIFLTTGFQSSQIEHVHWIKDILGKKPPWT